VRTADAFLDGFHGIGRSGVHGKACPEGSRKIQLVITDVDGGNPKPHRFRILDGQMSEPAHPTDHEPVAGLAIRNLDALVDRYASANDRAGRYGVEAPWNVPNIGRRSDAVFGEASVRRVAAVGGRLAHRLSAGEAIVAVAACFVQPRDSDPVPFLDPLHSLADLYDASDPFMARNERRSRLHGPVAIGGVDVGMADAAGLDLDEHLPDHGHGQLADCERLAELSYESGLHGFGHRRGLQ
jgi:hypothetical protein